MKQILIALLLAFTTSTVINAQKQSSIEKDSTENVKVTLSKKTDTKADESNTTVTVIGVDTTDMDTTAGKDDNDLPFGNLSDTISGGILISIIAIVAVFGLPVFILFVIFFFRYKNRKARYRLAEQAIAAGQPLPENFIRENRPADQRSQGIKNTFTGIGLFIFLWAITGEFGIGAIGLLIMFMGIGQWIIGSKQQKTDDVDPFRMNVSRKRDIDTAAPSATQQEERNGEKIHDFVREHFPVFQIVNGAYPFILGAMGKALRDTEQIFLDIQDNYFDLLFIRDSGIQLFNTFSYKATTDIVYFLLNCIKECGINQEKAHLSICGPALKDNKLKELLSLYLPNPYFAKEPLLNGILHDKEFNSSHFIHLLNLHRCGL